MKGRQQDFEPWHDSPFNDVLSSLDIAVFERENQGELRLRGRPPDWWSVCFGAADGAVLDLSRCSPFLQDYLAGAHPAWESTPGMIEKSGPWTDSDRQGGTMTLEATILSIGSRRLLLIERLGPAFEQMRDIVQRARERALAEDIAVKSHRKAETRLIGQLEASERTKDDALALLQHLKLAALVLDEQGSITFVTDCGLATLGLASENVVGRQWEQALPFQKQDRLMIRAAIEVSLLSSQQLRQQQPE